MCCSKDLQYEENCVIQGSYKVKKHNIPKIPTPFRGRKKGLFWFSSAVVPLHKPIMFYCTKALSSSIISSFYSPYLVALDIPSVHSCIPREPPNTSDADIWRWHNAKQSTNISLGFPLVSLFLRPSWYHDILQFLLMAYQKYMVCLFFWCNWPILFVS